VKDLTKLPHIGLMLCVIKIFFVMKKNGTIDEGFEFIGVSGL
jgi:hypothetical protein